ncbi:hypothetical protein SDD30_08985 [Moorella naiadis]
MNSYERAAATLQGEIPDRVPTQTVQKYGRYNRETGELLWPQ